MSTPPAPSAAAAPRLDRRRVLAWVLFDFANSSYSAVITVAVFSVYFARQIVGNAAGRGDLVWGWVIGLSMALVALTGPALGAVADRAGVRKRMFVSFTLVCVACVALFTTIRAGAETPGGFVPGAVAWGFLLATLANFAFESAQVYYNAYLVDVAPPERRGFVSGLGYGVGYAGSIAGLLIAIPLVRAGRFDLVWLSVAAFLGVFALPAFLGLPPDRPRPGAPPAHEAVTRVWTLAADLLATRDLRRFLVAFFFYMDGVETTIYFSGIFAATTLGFTQAEVITLFIAVQASALVGALALAHPTDRWGPKRVITLALVLWTSVAVGAYFVESKTTFFGVAVIAGVGLGVVQAASRALMAALTPPGKEGEMFGFYALCGKSSSVLGPIVFGAVSFLLGGNQRAAVLSVAAFFLVGLLLLQRVRTVESAAPRGAAPPPVVPTRRREP